MFCDQERFTAVWLCHHQEGPQFITCFCNRVWAISGMTKRSCPCHAQHTEINLICFPLFQTALQLVVGGKAALTVKLAETRPAGLRQRKETKELCPWNSVLQCAPPMPGAEGSARGIPTGLRCLPTVSTSTEWWAFL